MNKFGFLALFLVSMVGCAGFLKRIPDAENYEYSDIYHHRYKLRLKNGNIDDTSWITDSSGLPIETLKWWFNGKEKPKIDTILKNQAVISQQDSCTPTGSSNCQRSIESILKVIRNEVPKLKNTYDSYLKRYRFGGIIRLMLKIGPKGEIKYFYLLGNSTGSHEFALEVLKLVDSWKFEKIDNKTFDIVTVPLTFSP